MKKVVVVLSLVLLFTITAKSQESMMDESFLLKNFFGVTLGVGLTSYSGSVSFYADRVDCEPYEFSSKSGSDINFLFGVTAERRLSRFFNLYLSVLYESRSAGFGSLNYDERVYVSDERPFEPGSFRQDLDATINLVSITPMLKWKPFRFDLGILAGPSVAFMMSDELLAKEKILEPSDLFYQEVGRRERTVYSGEIESKNSLLIDLKFGLSYGYMIADNIKLSAEGFYMLPITKVNSEDDWKISAIQLMLNLSYGF